MKLSISGIKLKKDKDEWDYSTSCSVCEQSFSMVKLIT